MSKYARLENNKVMEIIDFNPQGKFTDEIVAQFVECPDNTEQNMICQGGEFLKPQPIAPTLEEIRNIRNNLLLQCDWTQLQDSPLTTSEKELWVIYRQSLRDFPEFVDLNNVVFPTKP